MDGTNMIRRKSLIYRYRIVFQIWLPSMKTFLYLHLIQILLPPIPPHPKKMILLGIILYSNRDLTVDFHYPTCTFHQK